MDDFFAELDAEVAKATAASKVKAQAETARKRALNMRLPSAERQAAGLEWKELSKQLEAEQWQTLSLVALFSEQTCDGCGSVHTVFTQYMELQQLRKKPSTQRWIRALRPNFTLERETLIQPSTTHICAHCCEEHGFALDAAARLAQREYTTGPSTTYEQEDINAAA